MSQAEAVTPGPPAPQPGPVTPGPPAPPRPGFWLALLFCVGYLFVTQIPGAIVAALLLMLFLVLFPGAITIEQLQAKGEALPPLFGVALGAGLAVAHLLGIGVALLALRLLASRDWARQVGLRRPSLAHLALAVAAFPALTLLGGVAYTALHQVLPSMSDWGLGGMDEMLKTLAAWPVPIAVLLIAVLPGVGEELWCRAFLGRGLVARYGPWLGVLFTSLFFGLLHVDPCQGTMAMLIGAGLHDVYLTTRSLWLPILLHFLNNTAGVVAPRFEALARLDESPQGPPAHLLLSAAALLAAVGWALWAGRARVVGDWRPAYPGVEGPPPGADARIAHPAAPLPCAAAAAAFVAFVVSFVLAVARG
jgi:membrane protease YdiL (CAAX protease family)